MFRLHPLRFSFVARQSIHFPPGKSANILRGAFGTIFRRIACVPHCPGARECELRASCPYARMFEPSALAGGPSGLADWPRPFVFRATHLDDCTLAAGSCFHFDLNLFDVRAPAAVAYLVLSFAQLALEGLGPGRGRAELAEVVQLDPAARIYDGQSFLLPQAVEPMSLSLEPAAERVERVRVRFVTPTELKSGQQLAGRPEFGVLAARIRDRLSTLRQMYDDGPLPIDFRAFGERAALVRMTRCDLGRVEVVRRSSRTGQVHPIGGFVGEAEYEGDLAEFVPYLRAAKWTGVGRQTVWGKGEVEVGT
ncbi:MAG: CRISPR system precrRNA processing endoribonuclease RAMP protein Cas6 [Acidobacteria bacterium]|nr:CRISPR system precrRNA processing endoribonuclease RAMP protein Cas6 [Acidobacteriota bacterium]